MHTYARATHFLNYSSSPTPTTPLPLPVALRCEIPTALFLLTLALRHNVTDNSRSRTFVVRACECVCFNLGLFFGIALFQLRSRNDEKKHDSSTHTAQTHIHTRLTEKKKKYSSWLECHSFSRFVRRLELD